MSGPPTDGTQRCSHGALSPDCPICEGNWRANRDRLHGVPPTDGTTARPDGAAIREALTTFWLLEEDDQALQAAALAELDGLLRERDEARQTLRELRLLASGPHDGQPRTTEWYVGLRVAVAAVVDAALGESSTLRPDRESAGPDGNPVAPGSASAATSDPPGRAGGDSPSAVLGSLTEGEHTGEGG